MPLKHLARSAVAGIVLAGCLPSSPTRQGQEVSGLYDIFMLAAIGVFILVTALMAWAVIRYRAREGEDELPAQTHGSMRLEVAWWAAPTVLVAALAVLTAVVLASVNSRAEEPAVTVNVEGFQWQWRFTYEGTDVVVTGTQDDPPELVLPVGEPIAFVITSRDVIHSFSVPSFLIKRDAVPGRENRFDIELTEQGTYSGQCGEFCGLLHAYQRFSIRAVAVDEFEAWLADAPTAAGGNDDDG
ncbi:MAG: cytochrome c oxidase subunit II [Candidatus Limnocylindria bacterium]